MSPLFGRPDISSELSQPFLASRKLKEYWEVNNEHMEHPYHRHPEHKQKVNGNQRRR